MADDIGAAVRGTVSSHVTRLVLHTAHDAGLRDTDASRLPGLAGDSLSDDFARPPTESLLRLWEMFTATAPAPGAGLRVAGNAVLGRLHVWDYLFTGASSLAAGARLAAEHLHLLVDPSAVMTVQEDGALLTIGYSSETAWTPAADGIHEFFTALILRRGREAVGRELVPVHVGFAHDAPRSHRHLTDAFGTSRLDFSGPANSVTFLAADTSAAKPADPALTRILSQYASMVAVASRPAPGWWEQFERFLGLAIADGGWSLTDLARRLNITSRTLQRRLNDHDTTWQREVDRARSAHAVALRAAGLPMSAIAARLGYSDARSLRRAMQRWAAADTETSPADSPG